MVQLNYNPLYRWFVGLLPDDPVWDPTTLIRNRERLQAGEVFEKFMTRRLSHPQVKLSSRCSMGSRSSLERSRTLTPDRVRASWRFPRRSRFGSPVPLASVRHAPIQPSSD